MIDRDPPRLLQSARDAHVREALQAASARTPSAAQLDALAAKVSAASAASSSTGFFAQLLGQTTAIKVSLAVIALGSALWLSLRPSPVPADAHRSPLGAVPVAPQARAALALRAQPAQLERAATEAKVQAALPARPALSKEPASSLAKPSSAPRARAAGVRRVRATDARAAVAESPSSERAPADDPVEDPVEDAVAAPEPRQAPSELALLGRVQGLLARDPDAALALLEEHRDSFPRGAFSEEREALAIDALRRLGRRVELRARAQAFLARYPASPHCDRIRAWLE
jgi:hypothetical protein